MIEAARIILAPFANDRSREWPEANFQRFIERGLQEGRRYEVLGTLSQRPMADSLVRPYSADKVTNLCGVIPWPEVKAKLSSAAFVVANNSGLAHVSAALGQWTLCVFSGRHSWIEWMPRGPRVVTLTKALSCSPCSLGSERCHNGVACMTDFGPAEVFWCFNYARSSVATLAASG